MTDLTQSQQRKQADIDLLRKRYTTDVRNELRTIDYRLVEYFDDLTTHVSTMFGDTNDRHNRYEVLCGAKFLRMFTTYHFNKKFVRFVIRMREGEWERRGRTWHYLSDGLRLPSTQGAKVYRWQPFQVFVLATVFGFYAWFNTHVSTDEKPELLPTERDRDGIVWDYRRMINEFILYGPRKIDKTGLSSYIQVIFFLLGDFNSETYSLAMTEDQSKILFNRTKFMLRQLSPDQDGNDRFHMTEKIVDWLPKYQGEIHNSKIVPLTAGGKAPDGTNTELLNWDELGSSPYINGKSDMMAHINVCQSSMGQRRQPLTFGTTTAGTITSGPFIEKLEALHTMLDEEHDYESGEKTPTLATDGTMCLLLEPDEYERQDEQYILTSHALRHKINPMLGLVVQYDFYEREMEKARREGGQKFAECVAKLFNIYQQGRITKWITGDRIRPLQVSDPTRRIESCRWQDGWRVFIGLDFSHGDDLFAVTYLGVDYNHAQHSDTMRGLLFADTDAWVLEATLEKSPNKALYEQWIKQGWLHVCPGEVFDSSYCIATIAQRLQLDLEGGQKDWRLDVRLFCYDPAQNREPINNLKAWLQTAGIPADAIEKMVIPCSQSAMNLNGTISALAEKILGLEPWMEFSASPLWPWCFGNTAVEIGRTDLQRIIKGGPIASAKIDPVMALLDALWGWQLSEGQIQGNQ